LCTLGLFCKLDAKDTETPALNAVGNMIGGAASSMVVEPDAKEGRCRCGDKNRVCCSPPERVIQRHNKGIPEAIQEECNGEGFECVRPDNYPNSAGVCMRKHNHD